MCKISVYFKYKGGINEVYLIFSLVSSEVNRPDVCS